jgi:hypothetical protein
MNIGEFQYSSREEQEANRFSVGSIEQHRENSLLQESSDPRDTAVLRGPAPADGLPE